MRDLVRAMVSSIPSVDAAEESHRRDVIDWIDSGAEIFRTTRPATPPKHLVSYCVLVDGTQERAFLVDHRDARRWLPTGGHIEPDEHPVAARRWLRRPRPAGGRGCALPAELV